MKIFTARRLCRAGIIAALYVTLTYAFGMTGYAGIFQFRPAEALCILPLFYVEAVPALFVGCMLANILSLYGVYDIFLGSAVTLVAALCTFFVGKIFRDEGKTSVRVARIALGGFFPVALNALLIPVVIVYLGGFTEGFATAVSAYTWNFFSLLLSQSVWIYALGVPLYHFIAHMRKKNISFFLDGKRPSFPETDPLPHE